MVVRPRSECGNAPSIPDRGRVCRPATGRRAPCSTNVRLTGAGVPLEIGLRAHPSCIELWFSDRSETVTALVEEFDAGLAERVWRLAIDRGYLREDTSLDVMTIAVEAVSRVFDVAFRRDAKGDDPTMTEAKRLVTAHLETYARLNQRAPTGGRSQVRSLPGAQKRQVSPLDSLNCA